MEGGWKVSGIWYNFLRTKYLLTYLQSTGTRNHYISQSGSLTQCLLRHVGKLSSTMLIQIFWLLRQLWVGVLEIYLTKWSLSLWQQRIPSFGNLCSRKGRSLRFLSGSCFWFCQFRTFYAKYLDVTWVYDRKPFPFKFYLGKGWILIKT